MTDILTRATVMALMVESTEGTPITPSAATDFLAVQDGYDVNAEAEALQNAELKNSLGPAKTIIGAETPSMSFSHYFRHSGTEGTAPRLGRVLKAILGAETVNATQYDTVAGSTVSSINVDTAEGANFERGQPLLVKDPINGYSIRPVHSISGDALTPAFPLANAPGTAVNLGKAVLYKPADSGHQSLNPWVYHGNGGVVEMLAGCRATSLALNFEAGQLINGSFTLEGIKHYLNPIEITSSTKTLTFTDDDVTAEAVSVTVKHWKDPHELAAAVETAMNATATTNTYSVVYSDSTGKFTITHDETAGTLLSLLWLTGSNSIATKLGYSAAADDTGVSGSTGYTSDNAYDASAPATPSYEVSDPLVAKADEVLIGDGTETASFQTESVQISVGTPKREKRDVNADSGISGSIISSREVTVTVKTTIQKYDADLYKRFRAGTETRFMYAFGSKSGGNWVAGKSGCAYGPTMTVTSFKLTPDGGLLTLEATFKTFVNDDGEGEFYLGFV